MAEERAAHWRQPADTTGLMTAGSAENVDGQIRLREAPALSLAFLVPSYLFLQLILVPVLYWLATLRGTDVTFLHRFAAPDEMLPGAGLAVCAIVSFLIGTRWSKGEDSDPTGYFDVDWDLDRALLVAYGVVFGVLAFRAANYFYFGGIFPEGHYNNLVGPVWVGALIFPSPWQVYGMLIAVVAALVAPPSQRSRFRRHAIFLTLLLVSAGALTRSRSAMLTPLFCLWFVIGLVGSDRTRRLFNGALIAALPVLLWLKFFVRSEAGTVQWSASAVSEGIGEFLQRVSQNDALGVVMQYFPDRYWGESFLTMFLINVTNLAPAWITNSFQDLMLRPYVGGNAFGREFGLAAANDTATGVGIPTVGDVYLNFGVLGVVACFLLYGVIARRATDRLYARPSCSVIFWFVALLPQAVPGMEHQVGILLANVARFGVFYLVVYTLIRQRAAIGEAGPLSQSHRHQTHAT